MVLDLKNTVKIEIDWRSQKSVELKLENDGYVKINDIGGVTTSALLYAKEL